MTRYAGAVAVLSALLCATLAAPAAFAETRPLSLGNSGADVRELQNDLIKLGYLGSMSNTGYFGALTRNALEKFQCAKGVICAGAAFEGYGVYGPKTKAALQIALAPSQPATLANRFLTGPATGAFEVSGWLPWWRAASSTEDALLHLGAFTSVMPFGYSVKEDGTLADTARLGGEPWQSFIAAAKARKVRVVPTVMWGDGAEEHALLSDTKKRIALENAIAALAKENGFDGIDIDFEAKKAETINYFATFLKGLYARMGKKWVYCTVEARMPLEDRYPPGETPPQDATDYANNYIAMNKYCDRVEIMAYDQGTIDLRLNAARTAPYAPVADPLWVADLVNVAAQSISKNKLIIGIPTYGYEYAVTPLLDGTEKYQRLWPFNPSYAAQIAATLRIAPTRTSAGEAGFTYDPAALRAAAPADGDVVHTQQTSPEAAVTTSVAGNANGAGGGLQPYNFVTWSDAAAIRDKLTLAKNLGVRGVAFFSVGGAEDPGMWDLLK